MSKKPSLKSTTLLRHVLVPHTQLAVDFFRLVKRRRIATSMRVSDDDPTYRFQIAGVLVFLSGVDKALSLTLELLYLAGKVDWKWMKGRFKAESGEVICAPGMSAKIDKLKQLGLDLTEAKWLIDLRNRYVHECRIYAGYSFVPVNEDPNLNFELRPYGPRFDSVLPPLIGLGPKEIKAYSTFLTTSLSRFLDKSGWRRSWLAISEQIARLPINPEPEFTAFRQHEKIYTFENCLDLVTSLKSRYIGEELTLVGAGLKKSKTTGN